MNNITTRFAPSPTGYIHVGGIRTALFAWLIAKQANGKFIFRIEDTDKQREVAGSEQHIIDSLHWLGLDWGEGPDIGGPNGPYKQSERLEIYKEWAQKLIDSGQAYADPYSPQQVEQFRQECKLAKKPFLYRNYRPTNPPKWDGSQPLRFKSIPKNYKWNDAVLGNLTASQEAIDDFILIKSDGYPTYNFCHIVDDSLMGVNYVVRSQEFIASVPKFLNLYEALKLKPPTFATLPYVMALEGTKKLSKRDGAKDILGYAKEGYLKEAMVNFLASLGWNDGTEQEIFSIEELINKFSVEHVQKSPARFDEKRLLWMNGQWIRRLSLDDLYNRCQNYWPESAKDATKERKKEILVLVQARLKTLANLPELSNFFFEEPNPNLDLIKSHKQLSKLSNIQICELLQIVADKLFKIENFTPENIQESLNQLLTQTGQKPVVLFSIIRIATTWATFSPDLAPSLALLGKDISINRLLMAKTLFNQ
ncbi:glutamate--tRNA ligase [Candidatus Saccharibacteria bacterium]|nr:glutamate--tRNA ligase [Candidatus Saccharibacteria bacterium]